MNTYSFSYSGRTYSGHIISSNDAEQYFWFVFDDEDMIEKFGDSIAFRMIENKLVPVYTHTRDAMFIEELRCLTEKELRKMLLTR